MGGRRRERWRRRRLRRGTARRGAARGVWARREGAEHLVAVVEVIGDVGNSNGNRISARERTIPSALADDETLVQQMLKTDWAR